MTENDRLEWLQWRRQGLGASDAAAVAGLSPYATPYSVWADKTGLVPLGGPERPEMRWGRLLEPAIMEAFEEATRLTVIHSQVRIESGELEWLRATLDGEVVNALEGGLRDPVKYIGVYESKTSNGRDGRWTEGPPEYVRIQVQHQMAVTEHERAFVAVLLHGSDFAWWEIARDQGAIDVLLQIEEDFWRKHVLTKTPPTVDGSEITKEAIRRAWARPQRPSVELPDSAEVVLRLYRRVQDELHDAEKVKRKLANELCAMLGDAEVGLLQGKEVVRWPLVERSAYSVEATSYRRLQVIGGGDDG